MPATSQAQQRFFGMVEAGKAKRPAGMTGEQVKEFASTPRRGLPQRAGNVSHESAKRLAAAKMSRRKSGEKKRSGPLSGIAGGARGAMGGMITSAILLASLLFAPPARATTYYVNAANGHDNNDGSTLAKAWATIAKADSSMSAGDVCLIYPGTYFDMPGRVVAGEASSHTYFYGEIAHPENVIINTGSRLSANHTTIAGVTFQNSLLTKSLAYRDTIRDFVIGTNAGQGSLYLEAQSYDQFFRGTVHGQDFWVGRKDNGEGGNSVGNVFSDITFTNICQGKTGSAVLGGIGFGGNGGRADSNTVKFCDFTGYLGPQLSGNGGPFRDCYLVTNQLWYHNHYHVHSQASASCFVLYERDSSYNNTYRADTLIADGSGNAQVIFAAWGAFHETTRNETLDSCFIKLVNGGSQFIGPQAEKLNLFTSTYSTYIASHAAALVLGSNAQLVGKCKWDHNTFAGSSWYTNYQAVVEMGGETVPAYTDTVQFTNNIVYVLAPTPGTGFEVPYGHDSTNPPWKAKCISPSTAPDQCYGYAIRYNLFAMDSVHVGGGGVSRKPKFNWNLFSYYGDSTAAGDRSIHFVNSNNTDFCSAPGSNTDITKPPVAWLFRYQKIDSASTYGSPYFADSSIAGFDPHLLPGSAAIGAGNGGTDIGAVASSAYALISITPSQQMYWTSGIAGSKDFTINNYGNDSLRVSSNTLVFATGFTGSPAIPTVMGPSTSQKITITYDGSVPHDSDPVDGSFVRSFQINSNAKNQPVIVVVFNGNPNGTGFISP